MSDPDDSSSLGEATAEAIGGAGPAAGQRGAARADVAVADADRIGVLVDRLRVSAPPDGDLASRSARIQRGLRPLGERLVQVECDVTLGGAVLRSDPRDMRGGRFFQVDLDPEGGAELVRQRVSEDGQRTHEAFPMTREELARTIDGLLAEDEGPDPSP